MLPVCSEVLRSFTYACFPCHTALPLQTGPLHLSRPRAVIILLLPVKPYLLDFFLSSKHGRVTVTPEVPLQYRPYRMPAATPLYTRGNPGGYLTQIAAGRRCRAQYNIFDFRQAADVEPRSPDTLLTMHFTLQGYIPCVLQGFGKVLLQQNRYHVFYIPPGIRHLARFGKGLYFSFHLDFLRELLEDLAVKYPDLREVLGLFDGHSDRGAQQHAAHITPRIRYLIDDIIRECPAAEPDRSVFLESMTRQLLLKYVQDKPVDGGILTHSGRQLMGDITEHIIAHPDYPYTIASLAEEFGVGATNLKRQFKACTGQTIGEFILDVRMRQARELLATTVWSVRDIAAHVGYYEPSNFDRAFRRKFGHPPLYYRH